MEEKIKTAELMQEVGVQRTGQPMRSADMQQPGQIQQMAQMCQAAEVHQLLKDQQLNQVHQLPKERQMNQVYQSPEIQQVAERKNSVPEWHTALYARLSCENNHLEDERSLLNQVQYVGEYIKRRPELQLVDEYIDNGHTGTNFDRPEFRRLTEDLKTGRVNCVVVKDLSRFGRNYLETGFYLEKIFPYLHIRFIAVNDYYDSMDGRAKDNLAVPIKNLVNEMYSRDISRKITATMRTKEKSGEILYGPAPYGYLRDAQVCFRLIVDRETAPYVKQMFAWTLQDMSYNEIAFRLNESGAETPLQRMERLGCLRQDVKRNKNRWSKATVKGILSNPVYIGDTYYNRSRQSVIDGAKPYRTDRKEWRVLPDTHEALVSREDFECVSRLLEDRKQKRIEKQEKTKKLRVQTPDVLKGIFYCADCGRRMFYCRDIRKGEVRRCDYYCSGFRYGREESCCKKIEYPDRLIRTLVMDQIRLQIQAADQVLALLKKREKSAGKRKIPESEWNARRLTPESEWNLRKPIPGPEWVKLAEKVKHAERLTYDLVRELISRAEIGSDQILRVTFRHGDWVQELAKMETENI